MCKQIRNATPCLNYKCSHNLFWEGLKLNTDKIRMTEKAFRIRNCCRCINEPWTSEEIAEVWGLPKKAVKHSEESGKRKLRERSSIQPMSLFRRTECEAPLMAR
jgi:hypothetical protein